MKKSVLALAIAAALVGTSAYADTTLYGSARVSVDYVDYGSANPFEKDEDRDRPGYNYWDVYNNSSRLGVRGEEDLGGGLSAIYQYEFGVDMTDGGNFNSNRPKWVGLKGASWGAVTLGTQWTPYYNVIGINDIFNSSRSFGGNAYLGSAYGVRMDNSLVYKSPNWSGFGFQAMLVMNGDNGDGDPYYPYEGVDGLSYCGGGKLPCNLSSGVDMWQANATYKNGPWFAGVTYMGLEGPSFDGYYDDPSYTGIKHSDPDWDGSQWGGAFGYNAPVWSVGISYENGDVNRAFLDGSSNWYLTGQYKFGASTIRGAYGFLSPDKSNVPYYENGVVTDYLKQEDVNNYLLGYQYNFSKRTRVWVEYIGQSSDGVLGDANTVSIGTRHDF